jgi:hypothetical protein
LVALALTVSTYAMSVSAHSALTVLLRCGATVVTVAGLASIARAGPRLRFFATWAVAVAIVIAGFGAVGGLAARQEGMPRLDYDVAAPVLGRTGPASDLDGYLRGVAEDFAVAQTRAANERRRTEAGPRTPSR